MLVFIKVKLSHLPNFIYIRTEAKSYIKLPLLHDVLQVSGYIRTHISENYLLILSIMFPSREGEREFCVSLPPHKKPFSLQATGAFFLADMSYIVLKRAAA